MPVLMVMDAREATLELLAARAPGATICPSEVARALAAGDTVATVSSWRSKLPEVHAAVDSLVLDGIVQLSWKRRRIAIRAGPYRTGRSPSPHGATN